MNIISSYVPLHIWILQFQDVNNVNLKAKVIIASDASTTRVYKRVVNISFHIHRLRMLFYLGLYTL
jgi:hypothetical protein